MRSIVRRSIAASAVLSLALTSWGLPAVAGSGAVLAGRVTASDGASPRGDVVVHLLQDGREASVRSAATDARGAFRMDAAPAGTYRVLVEAPEGAFLASDAISLADGEDPAPVLLALRQEEPPAEPAAPAEPPPAAAPAPAGQEGLPGWAKWTIVGGIAIGAAFVINEVTDEDEASDL
jgi:hypothetical protein